MTGNQMIIKAQELRAQGHINEPIILGPKSDIAIRARE
jgi:hypothetical protein